MWEMVATLVESLAMNDLYHGFVEHPTLLKLQREFS